MVDEIRGVGWTSAAQHLGQAGASQAGAASVGGDVSLPGNQNSRTDTQYGGFAGLAVPKDEAIRMAQSIRDVGKALGQADGLFQKMDQEVQLVKNYPPFPAGNEQRQNFINSINGLRRQLEALTIPPLEAGGEPVFYPKETGLPGLDPATASDEDVAAFGAKVNEAKAKLAQGFEALQSVAAKIGAAFPQDSFDESEVKAIGRQLGDSSQPVMSNSTPLGSL